VVSFFSAILLTFIGVYLLTSDREAEDNSHLAILVMFIGVYLLTSDRQAEDNSHLGVSFTPSLTY
ncbi:hypothetical protein T484DRAFT_1845772, partial [Baffinella frigidus]